MIEPRHESAFRQPAFTAPAPAADQRPAGRLLSEFGEAATYADLRAMVAHRRRQLGLRQLELDDLSGVQSGYTGKLEIGTKNFGPMSLECILGALGVRIAFVQAASKHRPQHLQGTDSPAARLSAHMRKKAVAGGRACAASMSPEQRKRRASKAANARWRAYRKERAAERAKAERRAQIAADEARKQAARDERAARIAAQEQTGGLT